MTEHNNVKSINHLLSYYDEKEDIPRVYSMRNNWGHILETS